MFAGWAQSEKRVTSEHTIRLWWSVGGTEDLGTTRRELGERGTGERGRIAPGLDPFHGMGRLGGALRHVGW